MNIYDMMKSGMSQEEIFNAFKTECANARADIAKEETAAQAKEEEARVAALKAEGRAHLVNALLAYSEAFGLDIEVKDNELGDLEDALIEAETQIEAMLPMLKNLIELDKKLNENKNIKKEFKITQELDPDEANEILKKFLKGLL